MALTAAVIAAAILAGLVVFQAALVAGKPFGRLAWGGQHRILPISLRVASALSLVVYIAIAVILLDRADVISVLQDDPVRIAAWVIAALFIVGIGMNAASRSKPERYVMTLVVLLLAVLAVITATG